MTCFISLTLFVFLVSLLFRANTPLLLAGLFFSFVLLNTVSSFFFASDFFPYMLYLIYVGGLLVLVVYMVIISTNYPLVSEEKGMAIALIISSIISMSLFYITWSPAFYVMMKNFSSASSLELSYSALVMLVIFLLFSFMYICESVRVGGRSLKVV